MRVSMATLEKAISNFVNLHPEGVSLKDIECGIKERNPTFSISVIARSQVFHNCIEKRNEIGEVFNPKHYRNIGTFKYYPKSNKPRKL